MIYLQSSDNQYGKDDLSKAVIISHDWTSSAPETDRMFLRVLFCLISLRYPDMEELTAGSDPGPALLIIIADHTQRLQSVISHLLTSEGSLSLYFSQLARNPGLTSQLGCIIRVDHSHSPTRPSHGLYWTTVVGRTVQRVGAPEPINTSRYGKLTWRSRVSWRDINNTIVLSGNI